jgi:biotin carboxylase
VTGPLLVLGASEEQLPLYREAARRGLRTIAVDHRRDRPCLPYADHFLQLSTRDHNAIAQALGSVTPAGIVSVGSDACLMTWHELSRRYRTPHQYPCAAAMASMDKGVFHRVVQAAGLPTYRSFEMAEPDENIVLALDYPMVVKPGDASGSRGITFVRDPGELGPALRRAHADSFTGRFVVEEFLKGRDLTLEMYLRGGTTVFSVITERTVLPSPNFMIGRHHCPAPIGTAVRARIVDAGTRLCAAMNVTDGPVHFDISLAPDGTPYLLETGARMCGNGYSRLLRAVYGIDTIEAVLNLALGEPWDLRPIRDGQGIIHLLGSPSDQEGELTGIYGLDAVRSLPGVAEVEVVARVGDTVRPFNQSAHKLGYIVATGDTHADVVRTLEIALTTLRLDVVPTPTAQGVSHASL